MRFLKNIAVMAWLYLVAISTLVIILAAVALVFGSIFVMGASVAVIAKSSAIGFSAFVVLAMCGVVVAIDRMVRN